MGIHKGDSLHEGHSLYIGDSLYETAEESVFPSLWRSLWRGRLVLVGGVGSKCFLIPGLLVWTLVWVGSVRCWCGLLVWAVCGLLLAWALVWVDGVCCWRGMSKLWRGDRHPRGILQPNQCSD